MSSTFARIRMERPMPNAMRTANATVLYTLYQRPWFCKNSAVIPYTEARNRPNKNPAKLCTNPRRRGSWEGFIWHLLPRLGNLGHILNMWSKPTNDSVM
ncbi:hypothetical protein DPEC_G00146880 [Dallia pectoralis]|uniref:Uncharacterized protein n=1 Tax=Dallia pectoralis TaxID=75939 RepID=A0ACC2GP89_DALPE|nr:hypothetical protein DPEC_G00146880 [Dallia pectoralis]